MRPLTAFLAAAAFVTSAFAQSQRVPLIDLGTSTYLGFTGGLYEHGASSPPPDHFAAGLEQSAKIQPLDASGNPSPSGRIVMLSIGMSNTTQEFCAAGNPAPCTSWSFVGQATADPDVNHSTLLLVNGARGGQTSDTWTSPTASNYDAVRLTNLTPAGVTEKQVQVAWLKTANAGPTGSLPSTNADAYRLVAQIGSIVRAMKVRYPNLRIVYLASRIYAGYASSTLNPEPYAYESGFAVKWAIQAQIDQTRSATADARAGDLNYKTGVAPWIAWGPYLWTNGMSGRSDGLKWSTSDVQSDGTHPSQSGQQKVGVLLLAFFKSDPTSRAWFLATSTTSGVRRRAVKP
jgi:hypothetical protein